ncbi:MAG: hypothetical protein Tsb0019_03290 [Roseibium sp.]
MRRHSFLTVLALVAAFWAVSTVYPKLFPTELPLVSIALHQTPRPPADVEFRTPSGDTIGLDSFRGSYLLVNVWATWCEPCRKEMPALDQLARAVSGRNIKILPISIDVSGAAAVERFYKRMGLRDLDVYVDPSQGVMRSMDVIGIPTTIVIDPEGRELGRMIGPAQWDAPESIQHVLEITGSGG